MALIRMPGLKVDRIDSGGRKQCREYGGMQEHQNMNNGYLEIKFGSPTQVLSLLQYQDTLSFHLIIYSSPL
jgi:hypothetical protein